MFGESLRISGLKGRDIPIEEGLRKQVLRGFFLVFSLLLFVPGCLTMQERRHVIMPVNQFPAFIVPQGQDVEPASDGYAVPDKVWARLSENSPMEKESL
jgi:hypothetical protein